MNDAVDPRLAAIERIVRETALKLWARDQTVTEIVEKLTVVGAMPADITPRDGVAAVRQSRRKAMLMELERLEQEGRGSAAVMLVARKFASDPLDPIEVESLARKLRRWRREKNGQCPVSVPETI
jgi:hypothetical protein